MLINQFGILPLVAPKAYAADSNSTSVTQKVVDLFSSEKSHTELNLVTILVEDKLLDDKTKYTTQKNTSTLKDHIFKYAENIQKRLPHTHVIVMGVKSNESTYKISTVLEKMYFEGVDRDLLDSSSFNNNSTSEDDNRLSGIVLVGDVPIPVVYDKEENSPSMYPYTDFYRKRYIYNPEKDHFELNKASLKPTPDIWHGVIVPPSKDDKKRRQELADYFYKNDQYSNNTGDYNTFDKRLLFYNFPAIEKKLNPLDYNNYKRSIQYVEELVFQRYNRHLLREMLGGIAAETEPEKKASERKPMITDKSLASMTDTIAKSSIKKYTNNFATALKTYLGRLNAQMDKTGRWSSKEYDSLASLITMRDEYMKNIIMAKTIELEKLVDKEIDTIQENISLIQGMNMHVRFCTPVGVCTNKDFYFHAFIDGTRVGDIISADQCGITRGQTRPKGVQPSENNSVMANINRTFNPGSIVKPGGKIEEDPTYIGYGGCTANNAVEISIKHDGEDINYGAKYCKAQDSGAPVFDYAGSKELKLSLYNSSNAKPASNFQMPAEQCTFDKISYHQYPSPYLGLSNYGPVENILKKTAYKIGIAFVSIEKDVEEVIVELYEDMVDDEKIVPKTGEVTNTVPSYLQKIAQYMFTNGKYENGKIEDSHTYNTGVSTGIGIDVNVVKLNTVKVTLTATKKNIKSTAKHVEPTDKAIKAIAKSQLTPGIPADGIRFIEFYKGGKRQYYQYPNIFKIKGKNATEVSQNLLTMIKKKDAEIDKILGKSKGLVNQFFLTNSDLVEPITWLNMSIDQKHQLIFEKYLNRDSLLPAPKNSLVPSSKPKGYEVLHIYADGDAKDIQFGINRSKLSKYALTDDEMGSAKKKLADAIKKGVSTSTAQTKNLFNCGANGGVEIWEWFPKLIGCWIPKEITQLDKLITLDSTNSTSLPAQKEQPQDEIFDVMKDTSLIISNPDNKPVKLEVTMDRKTLVYGEDVDIKVKIFNSKGKLIIGYLDDPLTFSLSDDKIAGLDKTTMHIFTGEGKAKMTAKKQEGSANLIVKLGTLSKIIPINVYKSININLSHVKETGKPSYKITASLLSPDKKKITGINTKVKLGPLKPSDGKFVQGLIKIQDGSGDAVFYPNPNGSDIKLKATHPFYTSDTLSVLPIIGDPFKIVIDVPTNLQIGKGEETSIPVKITDTNGALTPKFNKSITVKITDKFKSYGTLSASTIPITNGKGAIKIKVGQETGQINVVASHTELAPGIAEMPILAKIKQKEWAETFPQNLFASFVGFPAGNFFEKDYFGGTHLFNGKTQAVFASITGALIKPTITIGPNYTVKTAGSDEAVSVENYGDKISLQIISKKTLNSLLSTTIPLDFTKVEKWDANAKLVPGTIYIELTNKNFSTKSESDSVIILDSYGDKAATIQKNNLKFHKLEYTLSYADETDNDLLELVLANGGKKIGKLYLNFKKRTLKESDFSKHTNYSFRKLFAGKSTSDPTGLVLYDASQAVGSDKKPSEYFGFEKDNKYILRFGGGSPIGEATMFNLPFNSVLLGDPTIQLQNKSTSSLNYDSTIGRQIYQDAEDGDIISLTNLDFNNDNIEDVAAVMKDGRIRLFEGGATDPIYRDRGNIAYLADGALSLISFDFKNDGYDDLVVATKEGRLAILHNDKEVLTRTNQKIKVGKQLYQIFKADMDNDGYFDLVTSDSRGDIRVFYNQSSIFTTKPVSVSDQFPENGTLIGNYGLSIDPTKDLKYNLKLRYPKMTEPKDPTIVSSPKSQVPNTTTSPKTTTVNPKDPWGLPTITAPKTPDTKSLKSMSTKDTSKDISAAASKALVKAAADANENARNGKGPASVPKLPWAEGDETTTYFAPLKDYEINNSAFHNNLYFTATKKVANKDRPTAKDLDLEETLQYTITLKPSINLDDFILADTIPDSLELDEKSIKCTGTGCSGMKKKKNDIYLFISNLDLKAGSTITITYEVSVKKTPKSTILIKKLNSTTKLKQSAPLDSYVDILVSPPYNNTGLLFAHYSTAARTYGVTETVKEETVVSQASAKNDACVKALEALKNLKVDKNTKMDPSFMDKTMKLCGMDKAQDTLKSAGVTPEACALGPEACITSALEGLQDLLNDMACMGGGCFPMPYNMSFLTPGGVPGIAMPLLSFPTTLFVPIPIPVPSVFGLAPSPLGAADIPGPIPSMIRLYMIPTLTGGMGFSFCWGPYMGQVPTPPMAMPIPYPSGNCMTIALPMSEMPHCKLAEKGMTALMESANSAMSDINSGIDAVNNSGGAVSVDTSDSQGSGGLEISLATKLGNTSKFEPPNKGSSNVHIGPIDSIGGALASWMDKQMLEIVNKLFTLPTMRLILPNASQIFAGDWDEFNKLVTAWSNNVSGTKEGVETVGKNLTAMADKIKGTPGSAGSSYLENYKSLETEIRNFNTTAIDDLYAILNAMPLVNINETYIDFKIPYLSYAQIQDVMRDFEQTKVHYLKQKAKYEELIKSYKCPDIKGDTKGAKAECATLQILKAVVVDVDTLIKSIQSNIKVLQSYLNFPRDVIMMKRQLADYLVQASSILDNFSTMIGGWLATMQNQMIEYATVYYTIEEIVKQWKKLFDVFVNFDDTCDICTNERYANFGWEMLLGVVIPPLPIFKFPKWPDIVMDFSDITVAINIELPSIHFIGEPIKLPKLPKIYFPDIPTVDFKAQIPALPILPKLPDLPKLPPLPAIPSINLPTLPPPPKLPSIGTELKVILDLVELILKSWCLLKKALAPVPESYIGDHMALLTNRPSYLIPLDILKPKIADIGLLETDFDELRITTTIYLGIRLKLVLEKVEEAAKEWNDNFDLDWSGVIDEYVTKHIQDAFDKMEKGMQTGASAIEKGWDEGVTKNLKSLEKDIQDFDKKYFRSSEADLQKLSDDATKIMGGWSKEANKYMSEGINEMNKELKDWGTEAAKTMQDALSNTFLYWMSKGAQNIDYKTWFQKELLNEMDKQLNKSTAQGTFTTESDCKKEFNKWSDGPKWMQDLATEAQKKFCSNYKSSTAPAKPSASNLQKNSSIASEQDKSLAYFQEQFTQIAQIINKANKKKPVDYKVLQKEYNIPDYRMMPQPTMSNKIQSIRKNLLTRSDDLEKEIKTSNKDLMAMADEVLPDSPFRLAGMENTTSNIKQTIATSSVKSPQLLAQTLQTLQTANPATTITQTTQITQQVSPKSSSGCVGTCLVDPATGKSVEFIPQFDNPATVQTVFINAGAKGHSHIVYSDGPNLYLKRDLSVPSNITSNIAPKVPSVIFSVDDFAPSVGIKESINMLASVLTESGAANFSWLKSANKNLYGYGIEMEKSIFGYDSDMQKNSLADTTIILLPPNTDGSAPSVTVGSKTIKFGTLITSYTDEKEARKHFGIKAKNTLTGADKVIFRTVSSNGRDMGINVNANRAVYFDKYVDSGYRMDIDNGYYHIRMTWFDKNGQIANYNKNELLAPQLYAKTSPPIDIAFNKTYKIPVYKKGSISASEIFTDLSGVYQYYWDMNQDGLPDSTGATLAIPPQKEPKEFYVDLIASVNLQDAGLTKYKKQIKVIIYAPEISLEEKSLKEKNIIAGTMKPLEVGHDLKDIPLSIFRKRWGLWKNLGLLKKKSGKATTPVLSDKNGYKDNFYSTNTNGDYSISDFVVSGSSSIAISDSVQGKVSKVHLKTGQIELLKTGYELISVPASKTLPTRIAIVKKGTKEIVSNIYYSADGNTDVTILDKPLDQTNIKKLGVTIGDRNLNDTIVAKNIPGYAKSFPGGAAIYDKAADVNVALINTDGEIRMMQGSYSLKIKNEGKLKELIIFEIVNKNNNSTFDIYIAANFEKLNIKQGQTWSTLDPTVGDLDKALAVLKPNIPKPLAPKMSFSDVDSSNPYYNDILDLFGIGIISGYADGTFKPNGKLSRAEFIKIALGATKCFDCTKPTSKQKTQYTNIKPFPDVSMPAWYHYCVSIAKDIKMITGYGDGYFKPDRKISRAEAAAVLLRQSKVTIEKAPLGKYVDVPDSAWYIDYVYTGVKNGLIKEKTGYVYPNEEITRGEFALMANIVRKFGDCRIVDTDKDGMTDQCEMKNDLDPNDPKDAKLDNDNDGYTNAQECKSGTDPNKADPISKRCPYINNPNQNDTDKDGIIDACDDDIDNDGTKNILGLFDLNGLIDPKQAALSADNCIFVINADQKDTNKDKVGDVCNPVDQCPYIPEDYDGDNDLDGCPEVLSTFPSVSSGVYVNKGPLCQLLDYESDFIKGDTIMTAITDVVTHDIIYKKSEEVTY